jgi:nucleotide-binding universal stress UspA family protein
LSTPVDEVQEERAVRRLLSGIYGKITSLNGVRKDPPMYTKILVPMDGSEITECVLPTVEWFSRVSNVKEIVFLRVVEPFHVRDNLDRQFDPDERLHIEKDSQKIAQEYCDEIATRFKSKKYKATGKALVGKPAETITKYAADDKEIDLIIMATHGRSGVGKLLHGSTADKVIHEAVVPVLLVTPHGRKPE